MLGEHNKIGRRHMLKRVLFCAAVASLVLGGPLFAQAPTPTIKRSLLQKVDVPDGKKYEVVLGLAELPAGASIGKHTHPGIEQGTLIEGEMVLMVEGQPDKAYKAGESWQIPPGAVHDAKAGPGGAKVVVSYTVEKGQPLAIPVK
jgi:quercetin dioxygenase-like cupin family protein